ncbi:MAG: aminoacyl-tRNA hydrolase [Planctomycetes bacterium]|nr:aminoacyl-tRNA hydrolase [Planctomycetota bacterium]
MPSPIHVTHRIVIPGDAIQSRAVRASGPGGQNVNKLATKIQLRIDLERIEGLTPEEKVLLRHALKNRLDATGRLLVSSQATRHQARNLEEARNKAILWIRKALQPPPVRRPTKTTRASVERRLRDKRLRTRRLRERRPEVE